MRSDELLARLRKSAFVGDATAYPEYPDSELFNELNDRLRSVFSDQIISARSGYWLQTIVATSYMGGSRLPGRSVVGGLESVEMLYNGAYVPLEEVTPLEAAPWTSSGTPWAYWCNNESIALVPTPPANVTLRLRYYLRPSLLVTSQSSTLGGAGVDRGRITASTPDAGSVLLTLSATPWDYGQAVPAAITGARIVDVIRPAGWFTPTLPNVIGNADFPSPNLMVITAPGYSAAELGDLVRVGDYVRVAEQTDWPALPQDFHRMLADAAAVNVLREMDLFDKADVLSTAASADFQRFSKLIQPRVKSRPKKIRHRPYWKRGGFYR
jgi:hypothetical protein